jgi:hypothetical protein
MQKVMDPPEWEQMVLFYPRDQEIGKIVRADYDQAKRRDFPSSSSDPGYKQGDPVS